MAEPAPIPMLLFCPNCGTQHVDEPDERTPNWTNPPHKSHLCHECDAIWRPADVPTNGVERIETHGGGDNWFPQTKVAPAYDPIKAVDTIERLTEAGQSVARWIDELPAYVMDKRLRPADVDASLRILRAPAEDGAALVSLP